MNYEMVLSLLKMTWEEESIPTARKNNEMGPIYKQKGDPFNFENYY